MRTLFIFYVILFGCGFISAQSNREQSENISDCDGAVNIFKPGNYPMKFTGDHGNYQDLAAYPSLTTLIENNSIWYSFIAPFDGHFSMEASIHTGKLQLVVFMGETGDMCDEIYRGIAEIKRLILNPTSSHIGLKESNNPDFLYPLELKKGTKIHLILNTDQKENVPLDFKIGYKPSRQLKAEDLYEAKTVDLRNKGVEGGLKISIRDIETGHPIIANVVVEGSRDFSALYSGSLMHFSISRKANLMIKCDAIGYFSKEEELFVLPDTSNTVEFWLEQIGKGKSIQIEEIEFKPGTSDFLTSSDMKLRRLKDFLALNSDVDIEIQGHVFLLGDNTRAGQKMSEARAKKVMEYLIESGIDKKRLTTIGYGNTKPIYAKPRFTREEQANRRVEIKII
jgi:outer membrane protein OmpA-like peptidoglycan-associated protein